MASSVGARKGQVLAGVVTGVWNAQVFLDVGQGREAAFRSRGAARRFHKGDLLACAVVSVNDRNGRITVKEPTSDFQLCMRWSDKKHMVGWWHDDGVQRGRGPLSKVKVGTFLEGTITDIDHGCVFVDCGAPRDGTILTAEKVRMHSFRVGDTLRRLKVVEACPRIGKITLEMPEEPDEQDVIARVERDWGRCLALYVHGSTIFSNKPPQDIDLLAVVDEPAHREIRSDTVDSQFQLGRYEVSVYTRSVWLQKLAEMDLTMLTCLSLPDRFVIRELDPQLRSAHVDPARLHETIVAYAEFTWIKALFMLERKRDVYKSSKNVYFVFRVLEFGRQLLEHGQIVDFQAANPWWERVSKLYEELSVQPGDWDLVEVALASHVQRQFLRFHSALAEAMRQLLLGKLPAGLAPEVADLLRARPAVCRVTAPEPSAEHGRAPLCGLCSQPLSAPVVTLVRCGHSFHRSCAAARVRASGAPRPAARCWECRRPVQLGLDEDMLEARWRSTGSPDAKPLFGGYPATLLLPNEGLGDGEPVAAGSARMVRGWLRM